MLAVSEILFQERITLEKVYKVLLLPFESICFWFFFNDEMWIVKEWIKHMYEWGVMN